MFDWLSNNTYTVCSCFDRVLGKEFYTVHRLYFGFLKGSAGYYLYYGAFVFGMGFGHSRFATREEAREAIDKVYERRSEEKKQKQLDKEAIRKNDDAWLSWKKVCEVYKPNNVENDDD